MDRTFVDDREHAATARPLPGTAPLAGPAAGGPENNDAARPHPGRGPGATAAQYQEWLDLLMEQSRN